MMKKLSFSIFVLLLCSNLQAQTVQNIGASAVRAADDFATRAFQDPWDMNERTDLGWFIHGVDQPVSGFSSVTFGSGLFTGITDGSGNSNFFLLESGNPNAARLGKIGTNFPINANTHRLLAYRMSVATGNNTQFIWNRDTIYDSTTTTAFNVATTPGFRIYLVNLTTLSTVGAGKIPWSGSIGSLRMDPTSAAGETVQLDWARLVSVDTTLCRTITWTSGTPVDIYVTNTAGTSLGKIATSATNNSASPGCSAPGTGYSYYAGALAPGTYRVGVSAVGGTTPTSTTGAGTTWVVNAIPTLAFTSPSPEGSADDFATTFLGNPWDMNAVSDFDLITNVTSPRVEFETLETPAGVSLGSQQVFKGTSTPAPGGSVGDPYMDPLFVNGRGFTNKIDTNRYRILTFEFGIPNKARSILNGSVARIVWRVNGQAAESVSDDIIFNHRVGANVLDKVIVDMSDRTVLPIEQGAFTGGQGWTGTLDIFRVDPHEFSAATPFYIRRIKLAALEKVNTSYVIGWTHSAASGTVSLFYDDDTNAANGMTQIPSAGALSTSTTGSFTWNTSSMPNGTFYIYASFSDGTNTNATYSKWPIVIDHGFVPQPRIVLNRSTLNFGVTNGTMKTPSQTVRVTQVGSGTACWTVDNPLPSTFVVTGGSGKCGNGSFTVSLVDQFYAALGVGETTLSVRNTSASANTFENSPQSVHAFIRILGSTTPPSGLIDSPANGSAASGSIAVTGWAVDDIDITSVQVWLEGSSEIFIGNAVRVDDARPDVEAVFPDTPFNYRGGWGYMLLTNFLPGGGDGTYTLRIYATDREGNRSLIGTRTIIGQNFGATRPFGAIDTPGQGETISGSYNNFGWVLVRGTNVFASPALSAAASVSVLIDSLVVGSPAGWTNRGDLTSLFPAATYPGITHALGVYTFDTSAYANGVHTIAWVVTASNGQADGIGSRYFNIVNGASSITDGQQGALAGPVTLTAGADFGRPARTGSRFDARSGSRRLVLGHALERVVVDASSKGPGSYEAYRVVNGRLDALPIGASFDSRRGVLYWQPSVGYVGDYDFVIVNGKKERTQIRVVLQPQRPSRTAPRWSFDLSKGLE